MNELEKAVDLLENGWCAGSLLAHDGKVCAAGAIYAASQDMTVNALREMGKADVCWFESDAVHYVNESEAGKALALEIIEQGKSVGRYDEPYSVVWNFNDNFDKKDLDPDDAAAFAARMEAHKYEVIEMMKRAAKRLD